MRNLQDEAVATYDLWEAFYSAGGEMDTWEVNLEADYLSKSICKDNFRWLCVYMLCWTNCGDLTDWTGLQAIYPHRSEGSWPISGAKVVRVWMHLLTHRKSRMVGFSSTVSGWA